MLVALPGLILAFLLWRVIREPSKIGATEIVKDLNPAESAPIADLFKHRNIPLGMVGLLCAMCGIFVLSANIPLYLTEVLKLSPVEMGFVTSALGFGGFAGQWGLPAFSDHLGRRPVAIVGFVGGAILLWFFMQCGPNVPALFALLFASAAFSFGLLSLITGPIATEAAPIGRISTTAGLIIGTGEIFGGGLALVVAGMVISTYGIPAMLYLALGGLVLGGILMLWLKETAPRRIAVLQSSATAAS